MLFGNETIGIILTLSFSIAIISLIFLLILKMDRLKQCKVEIDGLKKTLDEMDEQAKLIVRTDIELNKTQEELDKKIAGLYALQRLSRKISTTLEEKLIFRTIEGSNIEELGFEKACGFLWNDKDKKFMPQLNIGYIKEDIIPIDTNINTDRLFYWELMNRPKTLSSIPSEDADAIKKINAVFKTTSFVLSPILIKGKAVGFLIVGTEDSDVAVSEGDEELITILANQIGQALENAKLFENTWRAQQELEKKIEQRTRELKSALDEVNIVSKRKSDFISAVSHELRTPLTSIKGYASILMAGKLGQLPGEVISRLDKINRHSDELAHLVNDLLDISRIESGRVAMKMEPLELSELLSGISDIFAVQFKEKQMEFSVDIDRDADIVTADRSQIKRVFINLIGNAIKFVPAQNAKIKISGRLSDMFVRIDVSDNGCGIPDEAKEKIFEEFYRIDNPINEQVRGTGLGLSLVKHIIEAHGGKIWVAGKINSGSTFSFTLPK